MKTPLTIALALLLGSPAFATPAPHQSQVTSKTVTLAQLKKMAQDLAGDLANADGCRFTVQETRDGITLSVRDATNTTAYLDVTETNAISMEDQEVNMEGSSNRLFKIDGQGSFRVVHADDAFESVELTDHDGRSLSCELDI